MENELNDIENEEKELAKKMQELKKKRKELKPKDNDKLLYWTTAVVGVILLTIILVISFVNVNNDVGPIAIIPNEDSKITFNLPSNYYLDEEDGYFYTLGEEHELTIAGTYSYLSLTDSDGNTTTFSEYLESLTDYEITKVNDNLAYLTFAGDDYTYYVYFVNDESNVGNVLQLVMLNNTVDEIQTIINSLEYSE